MNKRKKFGKNIFGKLMTYISLIITFFFLLFPIYWIFTMALKPTDDIITYPPHFSFHPTARGFLYILGLEKVAGVSGISTGFESWFLVGIRNSIIVVVSSVLISLLVGLPAAYILARYNFRGKENLAFTILSFRFAPALLVIIPLYLLFSKIGLYNTHIALIWVYQLISLPMILWIVRGYIEDIPIEIDQAGMIDGYSRIYIFSRLILPLAKGGIAAGALLAFIYCWNNFIFGMVLSSTSVQPVTVQALRYLTPDSVMYREIAAMCIGAALPLLILAIFLQRYLIAGLSMGAIKR